MRRKIINEKEEEALITLNSFNRWKISELEREK